MRLLRGSKASHQGSDCIRQLESSELRVRAEKAKRQRCPIWYGYIWLLILGCEPNDTGT